MMKAGEEGRLYGSVGTQNIADALVAEGHEVERSEVRMPEGVIREALGEFGIALQLHSDVTVNIKVAVVEEVNESLAAVTKAGKIPLFFACSPQSPAFFATAKGTEDREVLQTSQDKRNLPSRH